MQDLTVVKAKEFAYEREIDWEIHADMKDDAKIASANSRVWSVKIHECGECGQMFVCPEENWQAEAALGLHIRTEHPETLIYRENQ
jgi:hypothetical protein